MALIGNKERYGLVLQLIHWLTAILVLAAYIVGEGGPEDRVYAPERADQLMLHESLGVAVLALVVLRVLWRLVDRRPEEVRMPRLMSLAARLGHLALYLLLFAVPLTAIIGSWMQTHSVTTYYGAFAPMIGENHELGSTIVDIHTTLGNIIIWIAGIHAAAALVHHFFLKDRVLTAMLPWR
jgi:cytochrome b561